MPRFTKLKHDATATCLLNSRMVKCDMSYKPQEGSVGKRSEICRARGEQSLEIYIVRPSSKKKILRFNYDVVFREKCVGSFEIKDHAECAATALNFHMLLRENNQNLHAKATLDFLNSFIEQLLRL